MTLVELCEQLRRNAEAVDRRGAWPEEQMDLCREAGVFRWFVPTEYGGWQWSERRQLEGYLALSRSCLTTAFILTQWNAACKRMLAASSSDVNHGARFGSDLASGRLFVTVGISHLTTSRRHVAKPVLTATETADGDFVIDGFSPWVTGAPAADWIVTGATLDDSRQILCAVPTAQAGVIAGPGAKLVGLSASCTDAVRFERVVVPKSDVLAGPIENVMQVGVGGGTGGLQTSTLAIGLTGAALEFVIDEASRRGDLCEPTEKLTEDHARLQSALLELADGFPTISASELRQQANSLVLRTTQAAMAAAKGAGYVADHPVGRWCREALFFLVWSCPQGVLAANLCELAQS
ncbi:MAG: acyl-CoA dehydrogenase family protein [Pirellulales bacterium]